VTTAFQLRFPLAEITRWADAYDYPPGDREPIAVGTLAKSQGYLTLDQFLTIARWKSRRPSKHYLRNDAAEVEAVTRFAFSTPVQPLRLRALTLLRGVNVRTASAILHLCHRDGYPMMDFRAAWSLGLDTEPADWEALWPEYVAYCRGLIAKARTDMRTLDRALWGYSSANQPTARASRPVKAATGTRPTA
jgi:hypothetical protein